MGGRGAICVYDLLIIDGEDFNGSKDPSYLRGKDHNSRGSASQKYSSLSIWQPSPKKTLALTNKKNLALTT